jgi:hypothetical protein
MGWQKGRLRKLPKLDNAVSERVRFLTAFCVSFWSYGGEEMLQGPDASAANSHSLAKVMTTVADEKEEALDCLIPTLGVRDGVQRMLQ